MATKRKILYLYLTLVSFLGIIAIFVVDGYMGIYDTAYITSGEREQQIDPDVWLRQDSYHSTGVNRGDRVFFRYKVDNREFGTYTAEVDVSLWRSQQKLEDLPSQTMSVSAFGKGEIAWEVDTAQPGLVEGVSPEQSFQFTVLIKRGEIERRIIINTNPLPTPMKVVPIPAPPIPAR